MAKKRSTLSGRAVFRQISWSGRLKSAGKPKNLACRSPALKTVAGDGAWLSEEYVSGTPVNRLQDPAQARAAFAEAHQALKVLHRHTFREVNTDQYVDLLSTEAHTHIEANALIPPGSKRLFFQTLDSLVARIKALLPACGNRLPTVLAHGDFQPANILVDADRLWLIDWEYSGRRQAAYDVLTFMLKSRFTRGLSGRLQRFDYPGNSGRRAVAGFLLLRQRLARFPAAAYYTAHCFCWKNWLCAWKKIIIRPLCSWITASIFSNKKSAIAFK